MFLLVINCLLFWLVPSGIARPSSIALLAITGLIACAPQIELNSERIERRFGSYGVEVLSQTDSLRVANLYSGSGPDRACRTLAIVRFADDASSVFAAAHSAIRAGGSIGATLQAQGWRVEKTTRHIGLYTPTREASGFIERMGLSSPAAIAMHVYELRGFRPGVGSASYATIIELHHPEHWVVGDLEAQYRGAPQVPLTAEELDEVRRLTTRAVSDVFM